MGKTYKILVCGKRATGKTSILEQLIYNNSLINSNVVINNNNNNNNGISSSSTSVSNQISHRSSNSSTSSPYCERYFATIEDIYVACWEKDKGVKEKLRFYDTKGMENSKDLETINQMRHLFSSIDGAVLIFSSHDPDSILCVEKLKFEIEKSKDKKETCHFILIDNLAPTPVTISGSINNVENLSNNKEIIRLDLQNRLKTNVYEFISLDKRDSLCKPFIDLATNITQITNKGSMNIVQSIKKPKVFSSNK